MITELPFLTAVDPPATGEGVLDPLGLGTLADHLADQILPGLRARMSRPRFLTAVAVSAAVCEGLEERLASDEITPAYLVFEWMVVEAFVRAGDRALTKGTPGTLKVQGARDDHDPICARTYLRVPSIFGFHGIYKPLARNLGIVDDELRLADNGYELIKTWEEEQGLDGFLGSSVTSGPGRSVRQILRDAVEDGLKRATTARTGGWQGWTLLARHLSPGAPAPREASFILQLLLDSSAEPRGELFRLLSGKGIGDTPESEIAESLLPKASAGLSERLSAITAYENVCGTLEEAFDLIRYLSTQAHARPISVDEFASESRGQRLAHDLPVMIARADTALAVSPLTVVGQFAELSKPFDVVRNAATLFEATLERHSSVQRAKKPDGKRDWFERSADGATFVRVPYRLTERPSDERDWRRPYRLSTVGSFLSDLARVNA